MSGWIKFHRKILENEIWSDVTTFRLFTLLLLKASHQDGIKIRGTEINRGQYLRSYSKLAEDLEFKEKRGYKRVAKSTILRSVKKLVSEGMVSVTETDNGTLFTISKYHEYQGSEQDDKNLIETDNEPLSKRNRNDIETTSKQEQELKNLRIKELGSSSSDDSYFSQVMSFYQDNLQKGITESPFNYELIGQWFDEWGHDLLLAAMKVAAKAEAKGVNMIEGVLRNWKEAGVRSLDDARKYQIRFKESKSNYKNNIVKIPNYEKGDENDAGSDGRDTDESGHVRLFK